MARLAAVGKVERIREIAGKTTSETAYYISAVLTPERFNEVVRSHWGVENRLLARQVAEAQIDLRRVRYARYQLLSRALADPYYEPRENTRNKVALLRFLLQKNAPDLPVENLVAFLNSTPQGPHKFATILSQEAKQLLAMDRYERRALSRRKSAIRTFDETRRRLTDCNNLTNYL